METYYNKLKRTFGSEKVEFSFTDRECKEFVHKFVVASDSLAKFVFENPENAVYIPLLAEVAKDPYEIWQMFLKNTETGQVYLQHRFIKALKLEQGAIGIVLIFDATQGINESAGFFVFDEAGLTDGLNRFRAGKLIFAKDD